MQELEKILEEIDQEVKEYMEIDFGDEYNAGIKDMAKMAKKIVRKHMKNEEDILKFYYCESEDDYYIGQRIQNMYYAKYGPGGFIWFMSRYLPWGTDGYPSEPKEIPFMEWIEGFIRNHMNDGWILVQERLPDKEADKFIKEKLDGIGYLYPCLLTYRSPNTERIHVVRFYYDVYERWFVNAGEELCDKDRCIAWRPLPEPYRPERRIQNNDVLR